MTDLTIRGYKVTNHRFIFEITKSIVWHTIITFPSLFCVTGPLIGLTSGRTLGSPAYSESVSTKFLVDGIYMQGSLSTQPIVRALLRIQENFDRVFVATRIPTTETQWVH